MRVLLCHSYYTQRGGEDRSFEEERELLALNGHEVVEYVRDNHDMHAMGAVRGAVTTVWNRHAAADVVALIERAKPDVLHCTNTFPLISPSVCHAAHRRGVAVVQSLRNYRLLCANGNFYRDGQICEQCVGRLVPWPAVVHGCFHDSKAASAAVVAMQMTHRVLGTWRRRIDAFLTLTQFAKQKFVDSGIPSDRIFVKHNSVHPDPGVGPGDGGYMAYAARFAPEKGVGTLLDAWKRDATLPPLKIIGEGPLANLVAAAAQSDPRIEWLGHVPEREVYRVFSRATAVIMPSTWYETFGRTIAEAFAVGTPVIASRLGAMAELVSDGSTGRLFAPGDAADLAQKAAHLNGLSAPQLAAMRTAARDAYEASFQPKHNYARLMEIYAAAIERASQRATRRRTAPEPPAGVRPARPLLAAPAVDGYLTSPPK